MPDGTGLVIDYTNGRIKSRLASGSAELAAGYRLTKDAEALLSP